MRRGLRLVADAHLTNLFEEVGAVFHGPDQTQQASAAFALEWLGDARAIPLLLARHPGDPLRYREQLCVLLSHRPAPPLLFALLSDTSAENRRWAAFTLSGSGSPELLPEVERLARDPAPEVRLAALSMTRAFDGWAADRVRGLRRALLDDTDSEVQIASARVLADQRDPLCGQLCNGCSAV